MVEGGELVRVFTVAEVFDFLEARGEEREKAGGFDVFFGIVVKVFFGEVGIDGGVVLGGFAVGPHGEVEAEGVGGLAGVGAEVLEEFFILDGVGDNNDGAVVFGGGADHGGAADVDVFDGFFEGGVGFGDGGFKGVEVDDDQVDGLDVVLLHGGEVGGVVAEGEKAAVDEGMEGFDAAVHHFGEAGEVGDVFHGDPGVAEGFGGAAGGDEFDVEFFLEGGGERSRRCRSCRRRR